MLTFYPEFEVDNISENEIIFLLDLSNSMKVSYPQTYYFLIAQPPAQLIEVTSCF